jgi:hypothetical protein
VILVSLSILVLLVLPVVLALEGMVDKADKADTVEDRVDMVVDNNHMDYMTCSIKMCIFYSYTYFT